MVLRFTSHLGEESKVISPGFKTTKPLKSKTRPKLKEKENGQNPGCYKPTPLKKSRPRDLVAQGSSMNILT
jgi:hypothetical protein